MTLSGVLYGHGHMGRLHAEKLRARSDVQLSIVDPAAGFNDDVVGKLQVCSPLEVFAAQHRAQSELAAIDGGIG